MTNEVLENTPFPTGALFAQSKPVLCVRVSVDISQYAPTNVRNENKPSACPSKRKKMEQKEEEEERARVAAAQRSMEAGGERDSESANDDSRDPSGEKKSQNTPPSQICPPIKSCCYIKMQDPCAPCCCETKPKLPPCPPKYGPQEPRQPICDCDICQKNPNNDKCCDRNRGFRGISLDSRYFEKA